MQLKRDVKRALSRYSHRKKESDKTTYRAKRACHQKLIEERKRVHHEEIKNNLLKSKHDGKQFLSKVRNARKKKQERPNIETQTWKEHFENVLGRTDCLPDKVNINENGEESSADIHVPEMDDPITMSKSERSH